MMIQVSNHLLIPFGCPKWDISKIKIASVSTDATYFESETPCAYIDKTRKVGLRLCDIRKVFPEPLPCNIDDVEEALIFILGYIKEKCGREIQTQAEYRFLDLYFEFLRIPEIKTIRGMYRGKEYSKLSEFIFESLLPLPQAHFYLYDPLQESYSYVPENMVKVDFAFWTGKNIIVIEIDGPIHEESDEVKIKHIRKDRMLQRSGIKVCHILNNELFQYGISAIMRLVPVDVLYPIMSDEEKELRESEYINVNNKTGFLLESVYNPLNPPILPF